MKVQGDIKLLKLQMKQPLDHIIHYDKLKTAKNTSIKIISKKI